MRTKLISVLAGLLVATATTAPVSAHHSFSAEFDANKPVRLEGEVVQMRWVNPHSWLEIKVINDDGEEELWLVEGGSPGVLLRLGWTRESLPPGAKVIVNGSQAKDGSFRASAGGIEFPDGRVLRTGGSRPTNR